MAQIIINTTDQTTDALQIIARRTGNLVESLNKALIIDQLIDKLRTGVAHFAYWKKNGEIREAYGTTIKSLARKHIVGTSEEHFGVITYWDVERGDWRSFRLENIIAVAQ